MTRSPLTDPGQGDVVEAKSKYQIGKEFTAGFVAAIAVQSRSLTESDHWLSGWDSGYALRAERNKRLNEYLVHIGHEPMAVVKLQDAKPIKDSK
jgi:hypothetical protein